MSKILFVVLLIALVAVSVSAGPAKKKAAGGASNVTKIDKAAASAKANQHAAAAAAHKAAFEAQQKLINQHNRIKNLTAKLEQAKKEVGELKAAATTAKSGTDDAATNIKKTYTRAKIASLNASVQGRGKNGAFTADGRKDQYGRAKASDAAKAARRDNKGSFTNDGRKDQVARARVGAEGRLKTGQFTADGRRDQYARARVAAEGRLKNGSFTADGRRDQYARARDAKTAAGEARDTQGQFAGNKPALY
jgi:hypothetical protein